MLGDLRQAGIHANVHYIPVHTHPYYRGLGFKQGEFPATEAYYGEAISLPMFFSLSDADQAYVAERLHAILS